MSWLDERRPPVYLACAYCGTAGDFDHAVSYAYAGQTHALFRCPDCASLHYHPAARTLTIALAPDPPMQAAIRSGIKFYLDIGYSAEAIGLCVQAAVDSLPDHARPDAIFLDVGGGIGLSAHVAREVFGLDAVLLEPSFSGDLGGELLGEVAHRSFIEDMPGPLIARLRGSPAVLHLNSVIEHLDAPYDVLAALSARIDVASVVALVPDGSAIGPVMPFAYLLPYLAPGDHIHLPTRAGLQRLFARLGFGHCDILERDLLLIAVAARAPVSLPDNVRALQATRRLLFYLAAHSDPRVAGGAIGRLLPEAVHARSEPLLGELRRNLGADFAGPGPLLAALRGKTRDWNSLPLHLPITSFWCGVDAMHRGAMEGATGWFDVTEAAADRMLEDMAPYAFQALHHRWMSRLYRANALMLSGEYRAARRWLNSVLASAGSPDGPRAEHLQGARDALAVLRSYSAPLARWRRWRMARRVAG